MTHAELQKIAVAWLRRPNAAKGPACQISMQEVGGLNGGERADAWGYHWGWLAGSVLIEVKVSRADFLNDANKPHRNGQIKGMCHFSLSVRFDLMIVLINKPRSGMAWMLV